MTQEQKKCECEQCALDFIQGINRVKGHISNVDYIVKLIEDEEKISHLIETLIRAKEHLEQELDYHRQYFAAFFDVDGCFCKLEGEMK